MLGALVLGGFARLQHRDGRELVGKVTEIWPGGVCLRPLGRHEPVLILIDAINIVETVHLDPLDYRVLKARQAAAEPPEEPLT